MKINNNIPALNANRILGRNTKKLSNTLERLSSGKRINRASDDAAGMAISEKMRAQIRGLQQASRNSLDGISMVQTGEGALGEVHSILQRMRELSVQGANGIYEEDDLNAILEEMSELTDQVQDIANRTDFNGIKILTGSKLSSKFTSLDLAKNEAEKASKYLGELEGLLGDPNLTEDDYRKLVQVDREEDGSEKLTKDEIIAEIGEMKGKLESLDENSKLEDYEEVLASLNETEGYRIKKFNSLYLQVGANEGEHLEIEMDDIKISIDDLGKKYDEEGNIINNTRPDMDTILANRKDGKEVDMSIKSLHEYLNEIVAGDKDHGKLKVENEFSMAIGVYDNAISRVSSVRGKLGAVQNRLETSVRYLDNSAENLTEAMSRIEDVDMALEMSEFTKYQILQQSSTAMLGEANQLPTSVLQLLQG